MLRIHQSITSTARAVKGLTFIAALVLPLAAGVVAFAETMLRFAGAPYEADYAPFFIGSAVLLVVALAARGVEWASKQTFVIDLPEVELPEVRIALNEAVTA